MGKIFVIGFMILYVYTFPRGILYILKGITINQFNEKCRYQFGVYSKLTDNIATF